MNNAVNTISPKLALFLLLFVCLVWGAQFVLVDLTIAYLSTHSFNALRFALATLVLLPFWLRDRNQRPETRVGLNKQLAAGAALGSVLFLGFASQTEGLRYTSASNAGFITGLCVVLVPVIGHLVLKERAHLWVWTGVAMATAGLYFLTLGDKLEFNLGDWLVLFCALCFATHIVLTGLFTRQLPVFGLSVIQLATVALLSLLFELALPQQQTPPKTLEPWSANLMVPIVLGTLLCAGILGSALAYWAQTAAQATLPAPKVALIFATEPLFAHLTAAIVLGETLGHQGWLGAVLIIAGMITAELGYDERRQHP